MFVEQQDLIEAKFIYPRPSSLIISRPHLVARLDKGLGCKLTLISASAGFGKTTLLSEWLHLQRESAQQASCFAWVSLDEGDNDPRRFWRYIIAASQKFAPALGEKTLASLQQFQCPSFEAILIPFLNDLVTLTEPWVLILDDYHVISTPSIHQAIAFLLEHLPPNFHLIISTRVDPPLPLARLRASHDLCELRDTHLRFSQEEMVTLLQRVMHLQVTTKVLEQLEVLTEGWITGIQLVILASHEQGDLQQILEKLAGNHHYVTNYLIEEVLTHQPEPIQTFLLQTAFLDRFTYSLCDAVTGRDDSAQLLAHIKQANLFLISLDHMWYRYHPLFAEAMLTHASVCFGEAHLSLLYLRASKWYEEHGNISQAIETAIHAKEYARVTVLFENVIDNIEYHVHPNNKLATWQRWIATMPTEHLAAHPIFHFISAISLLFARKPLESLQQVQAAERLWSTEGNITRLGCAFTLHAILAYWWTYQHKEALTYARQALEILPKEDIVYRSICRQILVSEYKQTGEIIKAWAHLDAVNGFKQIAEYTGIARSNSVSTGDLLILQGKPHQAELIYQEVIKQRIGEALDPVTLRANIGLGTIHLAWNNLRMAEVYLSLIDVFDIEQENSLCVLYGFFSYLQVLRALGDIEKAKQLLLRVITLAQMHYLEDVLALGRAYQAWIALAEEKMDDVFYWHDHCGLQIDDALVYEKEREYLILARILLKQRKFAQVLSMLKAWQRFAHEQKRVTSELEILILCVLTHSHRRDERLALFTLREALLLAQHAGYLRPFIEEGAAIASLLQSLLIKEIDSHLKEFICTILQAIPIEHCIQLRKVVLPETYPLALTRREHCILRLLIKGLSNSEIAQQERVSVNTVKTQLKSIYRKLQVERREDAIRIAQHISLKDVKVGL